jgi:tetratricopeptide (TPR) repeat protein
MPRIDQIRKMLEAEPDDVFLNYSLAMELAKAGNIDESLAAFARVTDLDPAYVAAWLHQGKMLLEAKRYPEARQILEKAKTVAQAAGNSHACNEIREMLDLMP